MGIYDELLLLQQINPIIPRSLHAGEKKNGIIRKRWHFVSGGFGNSWSLDYFAELYSQTPGSRKCFLWGPKQFFTLQE